MTQGPLLVIVIILAFLAGVCFFNIATGHTTTETELASKTTPGELQFLYLYNKEGKPVKRIPVIRTKFGVLYLAKDGRTLKFQPTKKDQAYEIYKKRQPHLDKQILGH
jgi:hypothetical protein